MADALINNVFVSFTADENNEYKPIYSESGHLAYFLTREITTKSGPYLILTAACTGIFMFKRRHG